MEKNQNQRSDIDGYIVLVGGGAAAWFISPEDAHEWARENYFGQWLIAPYSIPAKPIFTEEQIQEAYKKAEEMIALFKEKPEAE